MPPRSSKPAIPLPGTDHATDQGVQQHLREPGQRPDPHRRVARSIRDAARWQRLLHRANAGERTLAEILRAVGYREPLFTIGSTPLASVES